MDNGCGRVWGGGAGIRKNKKIFFLTYIPVNAIMQLEINKGDKICT